MEITEVRIKLMENPEDRLRGFCSITFDSCFVIRDLKIIEGNNGPFVAMPSRKLTANCRKCRSKNHLKSNYCNQCGAKFHQERLPQDNNGRTKLYADIAHPINATCREMIQRRIVAELENELTLSKQPGYRSRYDESYDDRRAAAKPHFTDCKPASSVEVQKKTVAQAPAPPRDEEKQSRTDGANNNDADEDSSGTNLAIPPRPHFVPDSSHRDRSKTVSSTAVPNQGGGDSSDRVTSTAHDSSVAQTSGSTPASTPSKPISGAEDNFGKGIF